MVIDFVYKLNDVLPLWPVETRWSLHQIAEATETSLPHVVQYLSEGLGKDLDIGGVLSCDEATEALILLSKRLKPELEERQKQWEERQKTALQVYEVLCEKIRLMQLKKNWKGVVRTLEYFLGEKGDDLPVPLCIVLCNEILRGGFKSQTPLQELGLWLERGVAYAMSQATREGMEEALDLIHAYGRDFLDSPQGKGGSILGKILSALEEPAARWEVWENYKALVEEFYA